MAELYHAAEKRQELDWNHTAALCAVTVNVWSTKKMSPDDFHPMRSSKNKARGGKWSEVLKHFGSVVDKADDKWR